MTTIDWSDPIHWRNGAARKCRWCGLWTPLLDSAGRPAHKRCVEHAIDVLMARRRKEQAS